MFIDRKPTQATIDNFVFVNINKNLIGEKKMKKITLVLFVLITLSSLSLFAGAKYRLSGGAVVNTSGKSCSGEGFTSTGDSVDSLKECESICAGMYRVASEGCLNTSNNVCYCKGVGRR